MNRMIPDHYIKPGNKFKGQINSVIFEIKAVYKSIYDGHDYVELVSDKGNKHTVLKNHFKHFQLALINEGEN